MVCFLEEFGKTLAADEHAIIVLDGAGWHSTAPDRIPEAITMVLGLRGAPCQPVTDIIAEKIDERADAW